MASRKRRYLGCLGVLVAVTALLVLTNFTLSLYYRHQSALIAREMAKKGYPETFEEMVTIQNAAPPEGQRNGAVDLLESFKLFNDVGVNYDLIPYMGDYELPAPGTAISPEAMAAMKQMLDQNGGMLELISRGLGEKFFRLPIDLGAMRENFMQFPLEYGESTRDAARLMAIRAVYASESGDSTAALASMIDVLRLGERFASQPSTNLFMIGNAVLDISYCTLSTLIDRGHLVSVDELAKMESAVLSTQTGDYMRAYWCDTLAWDWYLTNAHSDLRAAINDTADETGTVWSVVAFASEYLKRKSFLEEVGKRDLWRSILRLTEKNSEPPSPGGIHVDYREDIGVAIGYPLLIYTRSVEARRRCALLAIRVMRFQVETTKLPTAEEFNTLAADLHDPFDGLPMRFRTTDAGFIVYSIGANSVDDGGAKRGEKEGADDEVFEIRLPR